MRLSMMLIPYSVLMRSSRYHVMYSSSIVGEPVDHDAREVALVEELLLETAEEPLRGRVLSGEQPFTLIERVRPCSLQMRIHSGHR